LLALKSIPLNREGAVDTSSNLVLCFMAKVANGVVVNAGGSESGKNPFARRRLNKAAIVSPLAEAVSESKEKFTRVHGDSILIGVLRDTEHHGSNQFQPQFAAYASGRALQRFH
jgi:hypothetical protein